MAEEHVTETAEEALSHIRLGWNLGNTFEASGEWIVRYTEQNTWDFETAWGNPITPATLMPRLKALGGVRIPITWHYHFDENGIIDEAWMARVQEVVDQAIDAGLYCVVNTHHDTGADGWLRASEANYEKNAELFATLWRQIAERFRDYPDQLLLEAFNEMLNEQSEWNAPSEADTAAVNAYNQLFLDTVRATGGRNATRNLLCCTYAAALTPQAVNGFEMPQDTVADHLIAEVHFYQPWDFTSSDANPSQSEFTPQVEGTINGAFVRLKNLKERLGVPLMLGEFGTEDKKNTEDRDRWFTHVIQKGQELGAPCFIWDNGNGFNMGIVDRVGEADAFPEILQACVEAAKGSAEE